jgi:hypothetical protein
VREQHAAVRRRPLLKLGTGPGKPTAPRLASRRRRHALIHRRASTGRRRARTRRPLHRLDVLLHRVGAERPLPRNSRR